MPELQAILLAEDKFSKKGISMQGFVLSKAGSAGWLSPLPFELVSFVYQRSAFQVLLFWPVHLQLLITVQLFFSVALHFPLQKQLPSWQFPIDSSQQLQR